MIKTYSQFISYIRSIDQSNPRKLNGILTKLFPEIIPEDNIPSNLNEWNQHDKYSVLSYFLRAKEMTELTTDKFRNNYKASKVMLVDLERGRNMLSETSKQISNILQSCQENTEKKYQQIKILKQKEDPMSKETKATKPIVAVKSIKTVKEAKEVNIKKVSRNAHALIIGMIKKQKLTDSQIVKEVKNKGREIKEYDVKWVRNHFNLGDLNNAKNEFPKPAKPYTEVLAKKDLKALAQTGKKETAKPAPKALAKPKSTPIKKAKPVKASAKPSPAPAKPVTK